MRTIIKCNQINILCGLVFLQASSMIYAAEQESSHNQLQGASQVLQMDNQKHTPHVDQIKNRFQKYGPSSVLFEQYTQDDGWAMEIEYSFKYIVYNCEYAFDHESKQHIQDCDIDKNWNNEVYFAFASKFDFYVKIGDKIGRESSPVINRISNPSLHWRKYPGKNYPFRLLKWVDISLEHRSNGQVIEIDEKETDVSSPDAGKLKTKIAYEKGDNAYFDGLSRGSNYFKVAACLRLGQSNCDPDECEKINDCATYRASVKIYFSHDTEVNWGDLENSGVNIVDYDVVRLGYSNQYRISAPPWVDSEHMKIGLSVEYTFGLELEQTHSLDVGIVVPDERTNGYKLPWYLKMHFGPMSDLSNYTKTQNSIGFGILFTL